MTDEADIYCAATILIERYREDAALKAAMRADELLERGDLVGWATRIRGLRAIEALTNNKLGSGEAVG